MRRHHINFLLKFHKPTSRRLYTLRDCGEDLNRELVTFLGFLTLPQPYRQNPFHHLMLL